MFEVKRLEDRIILVEHEGDFTYENWQEYQRVLLDLLDNSETNLYILSDFRKSTLFEPAIVAEAGTAKHLKHEKLGLIVLLGGDPLKNFVLAITENRAAQEKQSERLRIHYEYDRAMEALRFFRDNQGAG